MKTLRYALALVVALGLIAALSPKAHAQCSYTVSGIIYTDQDCDGVYDKDAYDNPVDNCVVSSNGDCDADPLNCDVDGDAQASKFELLAGDQADWDHNGIGDACDDADGDTVLDYLDNCKITPNTNQDPAACVDTDKDTFEDTIDNCVVIYNPRQEDIDADGIGDWCDNCRFVANADQADADDDGRGDACPKAESDIVPVLPTPTPSEGAEFPMGPDFERGSGGCHLMASALPVAPWSVMAVILAAAAILGFRKDR